MSVDRVFYTEAKINGEWRWIDPKYPNKNGEEKRGCAVWGKSWLAETADYARDVGKGLGEDEISKELADVIFANSENWGMWHPDVFELPYDYIVAQLLKVGDFEHYGFVSKETISRFKIDEIDDIYEWLSADDYTKLSAEAQKAYRYFEWDSVDGWVQGFKVLKQIMEVRLRDIKEADYSIRIEKLRFVVEILP